MACGRRWGAISIILLLGALPALAHAKSKSRNGAVQITSSVSGAQVRVDGTDMGTTPLRGSISVRAGTHLVEVQKQGVGTMSQKVTVIAGATVTVQVRLERDDPPLVALEPLPSAPLAPPLTPLPPPPPLVPIAAPGSMMPPPPVVASLPPAATGQEVPLQTQATVDGGPAWYDHWWVWAAAGVVVAGAGVLTYELVRAHNQPDVTVVLTPKPAGLRF